MSWNYRILASKYENNEKEVYLQLYEVYYDKDNKPNSHTANPITIGGIDKLGIEWVLNKMSLALKKPILWSGEDFPKEVKVTHKCLLCGRDKFTRRTPHICGRQHRKRGLKWEIIYS